MVKKNDYYFDVVSWPHEYCPIPWWNCKEMYYEDHYKIKYAVKNQTNDEVLSRAIGIHMWNNFTMNKHCIDFAKVHQESLYAKLYNLIFN